MLQQDMEEGGDVEAHVNRTNELFSKLLTLGDEITSDFILCCFEDL